MGDVSLEVPLTLLALCGSAQGHDPCQTGAQSFGNPFDDATLARRVTSFEQDDHFETFVAPLLLQSNQPGLKAPQLFLVGLFLQSSRASHRQFRDLGLLGGGFLAVLLPILAYRLQSLEPKVASCRCWVTKPDRPFTANPDSLLDPVAKQAFFRSACPSDLAAVVTTTPTRSGLLS